MPQVMKIGQLAQATGVSAKTIRYYEQIGVLPRAKRTAAGYRQYAEQGLHRLLFLRRARSLGLSLQALKSLTAALDDGPRTSVRPRILELVRAQLSAVQQQISDLHLFQQQLEQIVQRLLMPPLADRSAACRCFEIDEVPAHRDNGSARLPGTSSGKHSRLAN